MNVKKKLRQSTIIPKDLYVERAADRQLMSVIDEMGRPAYILVARQMGKTNLLINMKRTRVNDVVIYLDLSNRFDSARLWFRNVVDSFAESYPELFGPAYAEIVKQRIEKDYEPNVEYDRHLRILLDSTNKNVVIVLDEIDSLINAPYSDTIFAQIRSMYFSRVNFPVYEKLTYVLSGVVEPSDLIKDKNISPFNIGEKIYLEDFSRDEFELFLLKSGLQCTTEVIEAIYAWTGGSPRVTWDICSEMEDCVARNEALSASLVDEIVHRLYLANFDRAPVDHIRTLVEADPSIRDSIVSIRYGKSAYLSAKAKSRLYLSGITRQSGDGMVEIKGQLVDVTLSDQWLDQISTTRSSILKNASQYFASGDYIRAKKLYESIFSDQSVSDLPHIDYRYEYAHCCQRVGNLNEALRELQICHENATDDTMRQNVNLSLGHVYMEREDYNSAVNFLRNAETGPDQKKRIRAQIGLMTALAHADYNKYSDEAIANGKALVQKLHCEDCVEDRENCELLVSAFFNVAVLQMSKSEFIAAQDMFEAALEKAPLEYQSAIFLKQYDLPQLKDVRALIISRSAKLIIENKLQITDIGPDSVMLSVYNFTETLVRLLEEGLVGEFENLLNYYREQISDRSSICETLLKLYRRVAPEARSNRYLRVLEFAASSYITDEVPKKIQLEILRIVTSLSRNIDLEHWEDRYLDLLQTTEPTDIDFEEDYAALAKTAFSLLNRKLFKKLSKLFSLARTLNKRNPDEKPSYWIVLLTYCEMEVYALTGKPQYAKQIAPTVLKLSQALSLSADSEPEMLPQIISRAESLVPREPIRVNRELQRGRNEKISVRYVATGKVELRKYKQVENDLNKGLCEIVDNK